MSLCSCVCVSVCNFTLKHSNHLKKGDSRVLQESFWSVLKVFQEKNFYPKNCLTQKNFWPENFFDPKYFLTENFWPEKFHDLKKKFDPIKFFTRNFFWTKVFFWSKIWHAIKYFSAKNISWTRKSSNLNQLLLSLAQFSPSLFYLITC